MKEFGIPILIELDRLQIQYHMHQGNQLLQLKSFMNKSSLFLLQEPMCKRMKYSTVCGLFCLFVFRQVRARLQLLTFEKAENTQKTSRHQFLTHSDAVDVPWFLCLILFVETFFAFLMFRALKLVLLLPSSILVYFVPIRSHFFELWL